MVKSICLLICGIGVFLTGMKLMGDGLGKGSAKSIRTIFGKVGEKALPSYFLGAGATAIVQSSAATTVMSMGLVGAGIMTFYQASAFVLGARLGTTVTGILVSLSSISITPFLMTLAFIGICLVLFVQKESVKAVGFILTGLGVLFAGMDMMTKAITEQTQISAFFIGLFNAIDFPLLLIIVGALFTALIQSSSATTGLLITLLSAGTMQITQAVFILIGATAGTCITSLLASIGSDVKAKRIAVFNLMTALIGVVLVGNVVWILKETGVLATFFTLFLPDYVGWQLSLFGVMYSFLASLLCLPLIHPLATLLQKWIKEREKKEEFSCFFIKQSSLKTPAVAVLEVKKEIENLAVLAQTNLEYGFHTLLTQSDEKMKRVEKEEERIDFLTKKISEYLVALASKNLPLSDEKQVGSFHHVIDDIERIGDHGYDFMKMGRKMKNENVLFSADAIEELATMGQKVQEMYRYSLQVFQAGKDEQIPLVDKAEREIDEMKKSLANKHIDRLNSGVCTIETGTYFYTALSSLERVGDHLENIAYSVRNIRGSIR